MQTYRSTTTVAVALIALTMLASSQAWAGPMTSGRSSHAARLAAHSFADPGLLQASDGRYYLYGTGDGFPVMSSATMAAGSFTDTRRAMREFKHGAWRTRVPDWVGTHKQFGHAMWAPHVVEILTNPANQRYVMYFTAYSRAAKVNCVGVATASSPMGPFEPRDKALVCPDRAHYDEAIDASSFVSSKGTRYLLYKVGRYAPASQRQFKILARRLGPKGLGFDADHPKVKQVVASVKGADAQVFEAPQAFRANGKVWLLVSRFGYRGCDYSTQLWSANAFWGGTFKVVAGMERYQGQAGMLGMRNGDGRALCGSGGAEVIRDRAGKHRIAFHVWRNFIPHTQDSHASRVVWGGELRWNDRGVPYLY